MPLMNFVTDVVYIWGVLAFVCSAGGSFSPFLMERNCVIWILTEFELSYGVYETEICTLLVKLTLKRKRTNCVK